jgi:hypothetical protein
MYYVIIGEIMSSRDNGLSRFDWSKSSCFFSKTRTGRPVNGSGNSTSRSELGIGCINHRINILLGCDISLYEFQSDIPEVDFFHN